MQVFQIVKKIQKMKMITQPNTIHQVKFASTLMDMLGCLMCSKYMHVLYFYVGSVVKMKSQLQHFNVTAMKTSELLALMSVMIKELSRRDNLYS